MKISNQSYDILKLIALLFMPISTFIGAILSIWNIPHAEQITATLAAFDTLIGGLVGVSAYKHNKPYEIPIDELTYIDDEEVKAEEV